MRHVLVLAVVLVGCAAAPVELSVSTAEAAREVVFQYLGKHGGIKAEHGFVVSPLIRLAADTERLGSVGTPYWEIRRTDMHDGFNIDGLFWVNAQTGEVLQLHPTVLDDRRLRSAGDALP